MCPRVVFNTLFGLSVNYWMAISTRFLLGALNGLLGPIKVHNFSELLYGRQSKFDAPSVFYLRTGLCHRSLPA